MMTPIDVSEQLYTTKGTDSLFKKKALGLPPIGAGALISRNNANNSALKSVY